MKKGIRRSLFTILVFAKLNTKRFFRDKVALFFGILFPVIFLFVFGGIFGHDSGVSFNVALINQSDSSYAKDFAKDIRGAKTFKVDPEISTLDAAKAKMSRSQIDAAIVLPADFGKNQRDGKPGGEVKIVYTQNNAQAGQVLISALQRGLQPTNAKFVQTELPFKATGQQLNEKSLSPFDYTFAGLLGFSIIGMGIFGPVNIFPELKKQGILRRLHTTPLRVWEYFLSIVASQIVQGLVSLGVLFTIAITVFHLKVVGNPFEIALYLILSIAMILGIGLALGGWAKNERQAAPLSNIIVFPMMFLSGTFFPRFLMPEWLQHVSAFLPLTPVIDGVRLMATEGKHFADLMPQLGLIGLWIIVIYFIAFRVFRWE
jgi:ABC-2 type transport system permease protein